MKISIAMALTLLLCVESSAQTPWWQRRPSRRGGNRNNGECPPAHPVSGCGRCFDSESQGRASDCNGPFSGGEGGGSAPSPSSRSRPTPSGRSRPTPPSPSNNCPPSHPVSRCSRCFDSEAQASAACGGGQGPSPSSRSRPNPPAPRSRPNPPAPRQRPNPPAPRSRPNPSRSRPSPPAPRPGSNPSPSRGRGGGSGKFVPSSGRLLIIGQDTNSIDEYVNAIGKIPAGVTGYSSVQNLEGLSSSTDYGTGNQHMQYLANQYPNSALAIGVYVVDQLEKINNGELRGNLERMIDTLAGFNRDIFFRFGYEADGSWNRYDPAAYKQAFRIAWEIVREKGVENRFAFVWQLASYCAGTYQNHPFDAWYPGDQYVDWVGISTFTPGDCNWNPQNQVVNFARQHNKPVMISEAANQGYQNDELNWRNPIGGGDKRSVTAEQIWNDWYAPWFRWIENNDVVKAVAYISADWDSQSNWNSAVDYANGYWGDTRVTANDYIKRQWEKEISKNGWIHA